MLHNAVSCWEAFCGIAIVATHALQIANHVDYLGGMPSVTPKPVKTSEKAEDMLKFDLWTNTVRRSATSRKLIECRRNLCSP